MYKKYEKNDFDLSVFLDGLGINIRSKISGFEHKDGWLTVHLSSALDEQQVIDLQAYVTAHDIAAPLSAALQKEKDRERFRKRADVKDEILISIAANNMERVRQGVWTVPELVGLTQDAQLKDLLDDINTLSYEIAYSKVDALTSPALNQDIKNEWKGLLYGHFYL